MAKKNTPEEIEEIEEIEAPVVPEYSGDWPEIALFVTEDGKILEPGDTAYNQLDVNRRIRREMNALEEELEAFRVLRGRIHEKVAEAVPPISSRDAARASMANEQRARLARDSQKQQLMERLAEMGLLPD